MTAWDNSDNGPLSGTSDSPAVVRSRLRAWLRLAVLLLTLVALSVVAWYTFDSRPSRRERQPEPIGPLRLLAVGDPFARSLEASAAQLDRLVGLDIAPEVVGYDDVRRLTLANATDLESQFDVVSFDIVWLGEYAQAGVLLDLTPALNEHASDLEADPFLPQTLEAGTVGGKVYGLPIQPHPELLWYRRDLLSQASLEPPTTTADVLRIAAALHDPAHQRYGIVWNAQRGQALGKQMAHFYAAFGQPLLDDDGQPTLNGPNANAAAAYALALMAYSPPDILNTAWDQRTNRVRMGQAVMAYDWMARAAAAEDPASSMVAGRLGYTAAPHAPGQRPVTPLGSWHLGVPANVPEPRRARAAAAVMALTNRAVLDLLTEQGCSTAARVSQLSPETPPAWSGALRALREVSDRGELSTAMRPAISEWPALCDVMGTVFHDMLRGELSPQQATELAQQRAVEVMRGRRAPTDGQPPP